MSFFKMKKSSHLQKVFLRSSRLLKRNIYHREGGKRLDTVYKGNGTSIRDNKEALVIYLNLHIYESVLKFKNFSFSSMGFAYGTVADDPTETTTEI
jgi:hypothetical protein